MDLPFGVQSLQKVSVDCVPRNLFDFAEGPALPCAISTVGECRFPATKSTWFFWGTCPSVCDLYRKWVSISWHEISLILLRDLPFGARSLQVVSVIPCHEIRLILLRDLPSGVWSLQEVSVNWVFPKLPHFSHHVCRQYVLHIVVLCCPAHFPYLLLRSCWLTVCEFTTTPNLSFYLGSLIFRVSLLLAGQCWFLHQWSCERVFRFGT